jgi:predicted MFS family arabinose efflux permease
MAGCAMASTTLLQPAFPDLQRTFGHRDTAALVSGATLLGYMLGLVFFAPLSDGRDIRKLIVVQGVGLSVALAFEAAAARLPVLIGASFVSGALATVSAHTMALAARLFPDRRGRAVGSIVMGISLGMLLSRLVGGFLAQHWGWRTAPAAAAGLSLALSLAVRWRTPPASGSGQRVSLMNGLQRLLPTLAETPGLPRSAAIGGCWFAAFSAFWGALAIHLSASPFHLGAEAAGSFGLVGAGGALAAQVGGRAVDRFGEGAVIKSALGIAFGGFAALWLFADKLWAIIVGALLVDMGCFVAQAANQSRVLGFCPERQGQVFAAYMTTYYGAGALGGAAGPWLVENESWTLLCAAGAAAIALAIVLSPTACRIAAGGEPTTAGS